VAAVISGQYETAVAGGVESMTRVPMGEGAAVPGRPFEARVRRRYGVDGFNQGLGAKMLADKWRVTRQQALSLDSRRRATKATDAGRFKNQIVPVEATTKLGLTPRARLHSFALAGDDPVSMLSGPIRATGKVLDRAWLTAADIGAFEVDEAFAPVIGAWLAEITAPREKVNRQWRDDQAWAPPRQVRRAPDDHARAPHGGPEPALRDADHGQGRGHGQRHHFWNSSGTHWLKGI
jgi:acetyl-CoA acyltransferase